jgi:DNA-binding NarL/FixJ family response regulator
MASLPRIITVDPTGTIARIVRAAMHLLDRPIVLADIPTGPDALEEVGRGKCHLVITTWEIDKEMRGLELALRVKQRSPETAVVILADIDDPAELDEETAANSPFIYMSRPVDIQQFLRVLLVALDGGNVQEALATPVGQQAQAAIDLGPVPSLDANGSRGIVEQLLRDLGAMAIYLSSRTGEVLLEVGAPGYLNREQLTHALLPMVTTNIEVKDVVGGQASSLQFYDGENYDVFVLSAGLHHFLCVVFDGQGGARQLGAVSRYGRKAAEDIIAKLGANAWLIAAPVAQREEPARPTRKDKRATTEEQDIVKLEPAMGFLTQEAQETPVPEPALHLEPIENLDLDKLFSGQQDIDLSAADDLFDLDIMEKLAKESRQGSTIDFDQAAQLGILPS